MPQFKFQFGKRKKSASQWAAYAVVTALGSVAIASSLNRILNSPHGVIVTDTVCRVANVFEDDEWSRFFLTLCESMRKGEVTEEDGKKILGRGQQIVGAGSTFFDNDPENTDLRAEEEVSHAIHQWKKRNPSPKIDPALRRDFPTLTTEQLCVLSQAERYTVGDTIGIRYRGMGVCEEELSKTIEIRIPTPR